MNTLHDAEYTHMIISCLLLIRMRDFSDKSRRENHNTQFMFNNFFIRALYEIMWKNIVEPDRPQTTVWCMCIACWIPKATNTHSKYIIFIAFPLHECPSMLRYMCVACLVTCTIFIPLPLFFVFLSLHYIKTLKMLLCAGWTYSVGFISAEMIKDHLFPPSPETLVLMCGPPPMINFACVPNLDKLDYDSKLRFAY